MMKLSSKKLNRCRWSLALMAMVLMLTGGCSIVATTMWVLTGNNVPAKYDGLKEKKVVIVCRGPSELQLRHPSAPEAIADQIGSFLEVNLGKKIQIIPQREVSRFSDEHNKHDYIEVGEGLRADMVVGVELEYFEIKSAGSLRRGHARIKIKVYDMKNNGRVVYKDSINELKYPAMSEVSSFDVNAAQFKSGYFNYVAEVIARRFYPHDPNSDPGQQF